MTVTSQSNDTMRTRTAKRPRDRITRKLAGAPHRSELAASLRRIAADSCGDGAVRTRMTGARIMTTLLNVMESDDHQVGLETMCVAGGQGKAMIVERLN